MKKTDKKDKNLLSEATIRRFGMLANIPSITKMKGQKIKESLFGEEKEEEELPPPVDSGEEMPPEGLEGAEEEGLNISPEAVTKLVDAIAVAIQDVSGVPVEVEGGAGEEMPPEGLEGGEEVASDIPPAPPESLGGEEAGESEEEEEEEHEKPPIKEVEIVEESDEVKEEKDEKEKKQDAMIQEVAKQIVKKLGKKLQESKKSVKK